MKETNCIVHVLTCPKRLWVKWMGLNRCIPTVYLWWIVARSNRGPICSQCNRQCLDKRSFVRPHLQDLLMTTWWAVRYVGPSHYHASRMPLTVPLALPMALWILPAPDLGGTGCTLGLPHDLLWCYLSARVFPGVYTVLNPSPRVSASKSGLWPVTCRSAACDRLNMCACQ